MKKFLTLLILSLSVGLLGGVNDDPRTALPYVQQSDFMEPSAWVGVDPVFAKNMISMINKQIEDHDALQSRCYEIDDPNVLFVFGHDCISFDEVIAYVAQCYITEETYEVEVLEYGGSPLTGLEAFNVIGDTLISVDVNDIDTANFASSATTVTEYINRMAALLKSLNGDAVIPD
jgi:hypothetical protein